MTDTRSTTRHPAVQIIGWIIVGGILGLVIGVYLADFALEESRTHPWQYTGWLTAFSLSCLVTMVLGIKIGNVRPRPTAFGFLVTSIAVHFAMLPSPF